MPRILVRTLSTALLVVALSASQALACAFHQPGVGSLFEVTYPGSLKVAAATAQARSEGRLPKIPLARGLFGYARVSGSMTDLGNRLDEPLGLRGIGLTVRDQNARGRHHEEAHGGELLVARRPELLIAIHSVCQPLDPWEIVVG